MLVWAVIHYRTVSWTASERLIQGNVVDIARGHRGRVVGIGYGHGFVGK